MYVKEKSDQHRNYSISYEKLKKSIFGSNQNHGVTAKLFDSISVSKTEIKLFNVE